MEHLSIYPHNSTPETTLIWSHRFQQVIFHNFSLLLHEISSILMLSWRNLTFTCLFHCFVNVTPHRPSGAFSKLMKSVLYSSNESWFSRYICRCENLDFTLFSNNSTTSWKDQISLKFVIRYNVKS